MINEDRLDCGAFGSCGGTGPAGWHAAAAMTTQARTALLTVFTLVAFAANSVIGRQGLLSGDIGAGTFAAARLGAGALALLAFCGPRRAWDGGGWPSSFALVGYAFLFSYAYLAVDAGTGALILFTVVQVTMLGWGWLQGERLRAAQWSGLALALGAMGWWLWPRAGSPALAGTLAMAAAGIGWGVYSIQGLGSVDPVARTAGNFLRSALLAAAVLPLLLLWRGERAPGLEGLGWAALTGAVTSGMGYVLWYRALQGLTSSQAGVAQLTVPVIAAAGGVLLLDEPATPRFVMAAGLILVGVALATLRGRRVESE